MLAPPSSQHDYSLVAIVISAISLGIGVILGGIRVFEFVGDFRHGLSATMMHRSTPDGPDDDLLIMNAGKRPTCIYYLNLYWATPGCLGEWCSIGRKLVSEEYGSDDEFEDFAIASGQRHLLNYSAERALGKRPDDRAKLLLKLWVVGRTRPAWVWVN